MLRILLIVSNMSDLTLLLDCGILPLEKADVSKVGVTLVIVFSTETFAFLLFIFSSL